MRCERKWPHVSFASQCQIDHIYHQSAALKSSVIVQFHLKDVIDNDLPATRFKKFMNKDEFYLSVNGVYEIDMGNKDTKNCLERARVHSAETG